MRFRGRLGIIGIVVLLLLGIAGIAAVVTYRTQIVPAQQRFLAIKATQFYSQAVREWAMDFESKTKSLPYPYPHSFQDLSDYGYLESWFIEKLNAGLKVEFHVPPVPPPDDFIIIQAEAPSAVWGVRLKAPRPNAGHGFSFPWHEELREAVSEDAKKH